MKFEKGKSGNPAGRPRKAPPVINEELTAQALELVRAGLDAGEQWAIAMVMDRAVPKVKPITPPDSLDGELLRMKIKQVAEFEERLKALEDAAAENEG